MWQEIENWKKIHNENFTWGGVGGWVGLNFHSMSGGSVNNFYFGFLWWSQDRKQFVLYFSF